MSDDWRHRLHDYRDTGTLVVLMACALVVEGGGAVASVAVQLQLLSPSFGATPIEVTDLARALLFGQVVHTAGWALAGVLFAAWVRRVVLNSHFLRAPAITRSIWSGIWILVPVAQLWVPFLVTADLWRSAHDVSGERRAPTISTSRRRVPALILAWWATRVGGGLWACLGPLPLATGRDVPMAMLFGSAIGLVALFLQVLVARAITRQQQRQFAHDGLAREEVPPLRAS